MWDSGKHFQKGKLHVNQGHLPHVTFHEGNDQTRRATSRNYKHPDHNNITK